MREKIIEGCSLNIAVNHDPIAIAVHKSSLPEVIGMQANDIVWRSPDCKQFCKVEGRAYVEPDWEAVKKESDRIKKLLEVKGMGT